MIIHAQWRGSESNRPTRICNVYQFGFTYINQLVT